MTHDDERGSVTIWLLTASLAMVMVLGLAVDLGGLVHAQQRAHDLAAQAARSGGQQIEAAPAIEGRYVRIDPVTARAAATRYLDAAEVDGSVTITGGDTITVSVTHTYTPVFLKFLGDRTVTGQASARVVRSVGGNER